MLIYLQLKQADTTKPTGDLFSCKGSAVDEFH